MAPLQGHPLGGSCGRERLVSRQMIFKILIGVFAVLGLLLALRLAFLSKSSKSPPILGASDGRLTPCPRNRNCVSSQAKGQAHRIAAIAARGSEQVALARARDAINSMRGGRVIEVQGGYLRAEFSSRLFRFVDDLELLWTPDDQCFDVRSASRVGNFDLGANRRRVEALRRRLQGAASKAIDQQDE